MPKLNIINKLKGSLLYKYIASFTIPIAIISIIFSVVLFITSYRIIDNFVITQFESSLEIVSNSIFEDLEKNDVIAADNGNHQKYEQLLKQLNGTVNKNDIENAYILSRSNGKEHIVALSNKDNYKEDYAFDEKMNVALDAGSLQISNILSR